MTQLLNHSDINSIRSANEEAFFRGPAKAPPPALAYPAADRADCARVAHRDLQALRPTQLPLRRRTGTRPQALPIHNRSNRRTPAARLCAEWRVSSGGRVSRFLPPVARCPSRHGQSELADGHAKGDRQNNASDFLICPDCGGGTMRRIATVPRSSTHQPFYCDTS